MKKKIIIAIILALALVLSVALVACNHVHTFANVWSRDETNHWHAATCGDTDEVQDRAPHNFKTVDGDTEKCEECGYTRKAVVNPQPVPHEHTYAAEYSSDQEGHYFAATCEHKNERTGFQPHSYIDGICSVCGWWSSAAEVLFAQVSQMDVWNYALTFDRFDFSPLAEGMNLTGGELKLSMSAEGTISGYGSFEAVEGLVRAVVSNGKVYVCCEGKGEAESAYFCESLNDLLKNAGLDLNAVITELNNNTVQIREYVEQLKEYAASIPPVNGEEIKEILAAIVKQDEVNSTSELSAYVLNVDLLRELNETFAKVTVEEYIDTMFGEGFFARLPETVRVVFGMKVGDFLVMLEDQFGYTEDEMLNLLNGLIKEFYPDENVNSIEDLLIASGVDLQGASAKDLLFLLKPFTLETLLQLSQKDQETQITVDDIVAKVTELCETYCNKTLYNLLAQNGAEITAESIKAQVDDIVNILEENAVVRFYIDKNGVMQKVTFTINFAEADENEELSEIRKMLAGINGEFVLDRNYELSKDYSDVIDIVNDNLCDQQVQP